MVVLVDTVEQVVEVATVGMEAMLEMGVMEIILRYFGYLNICLLIDLRK
jgi:hypothetical protein